MSNFVLDSSAIIAFLNREPGGERTAEFITAGMISTVNLAEVLTKSVESGHSATTARRSFDLLELRLVDFDIYQATMAAELRYETKHLGLSLGDRSCLALAIIEGATAITADRNWKQFTGCPIEFIR